MTSVSVFHYFSRTNSAFVDADSEEESIADVVSTGRRPESNDVGRERLQLENPKRAAPPPSIRESLVSDGEGESDESEENSVITARDSVFTENTNQVCINFSQHTPK